MKTSFAAAALLAVALTACSKTSSNSSTNVVAANGPVAAAPPPAGKQWTDIVSETPDGGYVMGNPNAPVKLIEYASFSCPHCKHFEETGADALKSKYVATGKVSWEFRSFLIHSMDAPLTLLMRCRGPEPFFALTEQLYAGQDEMMKKFIAMTPAEQQRIAALSPAENFKAQAEIGGLYGFFGARGLPKAQADACLTDPKATEKLNDWTNKYANDGINETPSFVINGTLWQEPDRTAELWPQLDHALTLATGG